MGYIGRDNSLDTFTKQSITADGGTSFTLDQGVGDSSSILVSIGGIVQQPDVAYSASGTALVFTSAPTNAYPIWVVYLGKELTISTETGVDEVDTQAGVGDGTATPITLVNSVSSVNDIIVTLNGIAQKPSTDYTVSGTTLTFTTAPSSAMNILVYYLSLSVANNTPANYSVSTASQFVSSGTWPAWNGSNLTGAGGDATQADIDALIASLATLSFLQNIDQSTALLNMVNGWSSTFTTNTDINTGSSTLIYSSNSYTNDTELIDNNPQSNHNGSDSRGLGEANNSRAGQAITLASATVVTTVKFLIKEEAAATGNLYAEIQGVTGTVGSSAVGNDTIYAISNAVDSANIGTSFVLVEFTFANPAVLAAGNYWFGVNATSMSGSGGTIKGRMARSTSDHGGNGAVHDNSSWAAPASGTDDFIFYLYGNKNLDLKTKATDDLSTTDSPASAPTKGHIEALVDDRILNGVIEDSSSSEHTVTAVGSATTSTSEKKFGTHSMVFDGAGDYLSIPDHADFQFAGDYTVECWFNTSSTAGGAFWSRHSSHAHGLFINRSTAGRIRWQDDKNSIYLETGSGLNNGAWHHLALVRNGSGSNNLKLYIDGTLSSTQSGSTAQNFTSSLGIGYYVQAGQQYLDGYIDEFRISNSARYAVNFIPSTTAFTSDANTKLLIHGDNLVTYPTLNTDVVGEMSRDGGSTYSPATLVRSSTGIDGATTDIISGDVDFTGDPSGTNVVGRIRTVNKHKVTVDGISVNWS